MAFFLPHHGDKKNRGRPGDQEGQNSESHTTTQELSEMEQSPCTTPAPLTTDGVLRKLLARPLAPLATDDVGEGGGGVPKMLE